MTKLNLNKFIDIARNSLLTGIQLYIEINGSKDFYNEPSLTEKEELIKGISLNIPIKDDINESILLSISLIKDGQEVFILEKFFLKSLQHTGYRYLEYETLNILNQIIEKLNENQN